MPLAFAGLALLHGLVMRQARSVLLIFTARRMESAVVDTLSFVDIFSVWITPQSRRVGIAPGTSSCSTITQPVDVIETSRLRISIALDLQNESTRTDAQVCRVGCS